jgi:hypothetical protein
MVSCGLPSLREDIRGGAPKQSGLARDASYGLFTSLLTEASFVRTQQKAPADAEA